MPIAIKWLLLFCACQSMLFADEWNTVYLASFPRSGNHWVRFLVEEATHVATSSFYRDGDFPHLKEMFPWGGYCTNHGYDGLCRFPTKEDPVLLKTHYPFHPKKIDSNEKPAICLIRHPIDAFWSFYLYKGGDESNMIDKEKLRFYIEGWRRFYEFWEKQPGVLFIRYEDLLESTAHHLSCILETAGFVIDRSDIERAVSKHPAQGHYLKHIGCFDKESIEMIQTELTDILQKFNYDPI